MSSSVPYFDYVYAWYGRLGNNIISLANAIAYAQDNKHRLRFRDHEFLRQPKDREWNFGDNEFDLRHDHFFFDSLPDMPFRRYDICQEYIAPLLPLHEKLDSSDIGLLIPVRGEDVFNWPPHPNYVQCPFEYIQYVVGLEQPKKITLLAQDMRNPIVSKILDSYDVNFVLSPDISTVLSYYFSAESLVQTGITSFVTSLIHCSSSLKRVYLPIFEVSPGNEKFFCDPCNVVIHTRFPDRVKATWIRHSNFITLGNWGKIPLDYSYDIKNLSIYNKLELLRQVV